MVKFDKRIVAEILIFQLVNFDYFVVKNDHSLVTFNSSISHLQLTIKNCQIWLKFSSWGLIFQLVDLTFLLSKISI